jgi:methionyl-tRNA formyltransferase
MGTPDFAVPSLLELVKDGHEVAAVFTREDKPKGRGYAMQPTPVKIAAQQLQIPVYTPKTLKTDDVLQTLKIIAPDVIVVVAYGRILPESVLQLPPLGCINVHGSLLPKYRGAAPMQWAVINGESTTGVTTMLMDAGIDTGDMLEKTEIEILPGDDFEAVHNNLMQAGALLLVQTLKKLQNGELTHIKQDDSISTYAPLITKQMCKIDWNRSATEINNLIRGLSPFPGAFGLYGGKKLKIFKATPQNLPSDSNVTAGEIILVQPLTVACAGSALTLEEVQLEGKKRMQTSEFLRGFKLNVGERLDG